MLTKISSAGGFRQAARSFKHSTRRVYDLLGMSASLLLVLYLVIGSFVCIVSFFEENGVSTVSTVSPRKKKNGVCFGLVLPLGKGELEGGVARWSLERGTMQLR